MGDHDDKLAAENQQATAYRNVAPPLSTTTSYLNTPASSLVPAGIATGTRSGAPFVGQFDDSAPVSAYKNGSSPPTGAMQWVPETPSTHTYKHGPTSTYRNESSFTPTPDFEPVSASEQMKTSLKLKNMKTAYRGEDKDATKLRGAAEAWDEPVQDENPNAPALKTIATHYMNATEQAAAKLGVSDGKLVDANGKALDTTAATGTGTFNEEAAQKHIFAMTGKGEIRQADPWAAKKVEDRNGAGHLGMINHSSFTGGKAVAGAGEMRVEKGQLQEITDQSGHYQPDGTMVGQTLDKLTSMGVNMDMTSVKLVGKKGGQAPVFCSPEQFRQHDAETAEAEIRDEKQKIKAELQATVAKRNARLGLGNNDDNDTSVPVTSSYKHGPSAS